MKTQTQPTHTQGEWNVNLTKDSNPDLAIFCNGCQVATVEQLISKEETNANAQRIVKAVNMHDELVELLHDMRREYLKGVINFSDKETEVLITKRMDAILKQAEQK